VFVRSYNKISKLIVPQQKAKFTKNEYDMLMQKTILELDVKLAKESGIDTDLSGSTAILAFCHSGNIVIANVGDSSAIILKQGEVGIYPEACNTHHTVGDKLERYRILSFNSEIRKVKGTSAPERIYLKGGEIPGLAMSRSIGDKVAKECGVIPNPGYKFTVNSRYDNL